MFKREKKTWGYHIVAVMPWVDIDREIKTIALSRLRPVCRNHCSADPAWHGNHWQRRGYQTRVEKFNVIDIGIGGGRECQILPLPRDILPHGITGEEYNSSNVTKR